MKKNTKNIYKDKDSLDSLNIEAIRNNIPWKDKSQGIMTIHGEVTMKTNNNNREDRDIPACGSEDSCKLFDNFLNNEVIERKLIPDIIEAFLEKTKQNMNIKRR